MSYTIYMHKFPNGKMYVGVTRQDVSRRWRDGEGYKGQPVYDAIKKYGWNNIEHIILEENLTLEEAEEAEKKYIKCFNTLSHDNGYNVESGGYLTEYCTEETREKIRRAKIGKHTGKNHWHYGGHWDDATRKKISESHKGKTLNAEQRKKISERTKGKNNPMYGTKVSPEHRKKLQEACAKATSKAVVCVETGVVYPSGAEAYRQTGINKRTILYVCNNFGRYKTAGGYHWKFKEEVV